MTALAASWQRHGSRWFRSRSGCHLRAGLIVIGLVGVLLVSGPATAADAPATPEGSASAPAASAPAQGTAFEVVASAPIELGAPDSPRTSLARYFEAVREGRWEEAARYLVLDKAREARGAELAMRLKAVIDDTGWIDLETVSDDHEGRADDGLPPALDEITRISLTGRSEPLRMVRRSDAEGVHWAFSGASVARIDAWYAELPDRWLRDTFVSTGLRFMLLPGPLELLWWQWCALAALLAVAWVGGSLLGRATRWILRHVTQRTAARWDDDLVASLGGPLTLAWGLSLLAVGAQYLMLLRPAYRLVDGLTAAGFVFAAFWALWRATGVAARQMLTRPWAQDSASARTLISVGGNVVHGAILGAGVLAMLSALGYPIGTVLAGLGIGGLALAFGAQKTIENVFGSISIAIDQPFRVGDLVTIADTSGVVERIGLRSTRLRTPDRTVVSIPNGKLADERAESHAARDRFRLATTVGLTYGTTRAQMTQVLEGIEQLLTSHPHIWPDKVVVRLAGFGESSLNIDLMAWFAVPTWDDFLLCRQQVLLEIMDLVERAGADFAFPTRTVHVVGTAPAGTPA